VVEGVFPPQKMQVGCRARNLRRIRLCFFGMFVGIIWHDLILRTAIVQRRKADALTSTANRRLGQSPCSALARHEHSPNPATSAVCFPQSLGIPGLSEPVRLAQAGGPEVPFLTPSLTHRPSRSIVLPDGGGRSIPHKSLKISVSRPDFPMPFFSKLWTLLTRAAGSAVLAAS
jgi:hypothetical protein